MIFYYERQRRATFAFRRLYLGLRTTLRSNIKTKNRLSSIENFHLPPNTDYSHACETYKCQDIVQRSPDSHTPKRSTTCGYDDSCDRHTGKRSEGNNRVACSVVSAILLGFAKHADTDRCQADVRAGRKAHEQTVHDR